MLIWLKNVEHYKFNKNRNFEMIYKNGKNNHEVQWHWKSFTGTISIKSLDIDKIVVSNKIPFCEKKI